MYSLKQQNQHAYRNKRFKCMVDYKSWTQRCLIFVSKFSFPLQERCWVVSFILLMFWASANFAWHRFTNCNQEKRVPGPELQRISLPWDWWSCGSASSCWAARMFSSKPICRYKEGSHYCEYTPNFPSWLELLFPPFTTGNEYKPYINTTFTLITCCNISTNFEIS